MKKQQYSLFASTVLTLVVLLGQALVPATAQEGESATTEERPIPRRPDGRVSFGPPPGEDGTWERETSNLVYNPDNYQGERTRDAPVHIDEIPIQPWALALTNYRHTLSLASEPYSRCKPEPPPRQIMSPYGLEIVAMPALERIYVFTISNSMSYRIIYMDGRDHPEDLEPSYMGHSVGHWEGDTLVVDTVGFNERVWTNRDGLPHTDALHLTERFTRPSFDTLDYEVTIDDPGAYDEPWTSGYTLGWNEGGKLFEYICQENNISPRSMFGEGLESRIVP